MTLDLYDQQITQLKELIFDEIDRVGGYDQLSDELEDILQQILVFQNKE